MVASETSSALAIPGYTLGERIGAGGFGEVFRARHDRLDRDVAIKVLYAKYSTDAKSLERFAIEARIVNRISHPGIVEVFDIGDLPDGRAFYVMELLRGRSLRAILDERGALPLAEALPLLRSIAEALDALHGADIIHRDLKPDNVFVLDDGRVKLIDFGLAKLLHSTDAPLTSTDAVMGTPLYMSPEQCRGRASSSATDAYSFGAVAYHVLAGRPPFAGDALELALHHLNDVPARPSAHRPELTKAADTFVLALLAKDPDLRPTLLADAIARRFT